MSLCVCLSLCLPVSLSSFTYLCLSLPACVSLQPSDICVSLHPSDICVSLCLPVSLSVLQMQPTAVTSSKGQGRSGEGAVRGSSQVVTLALLALLCVHVGLFVAMSVYTHRRLEALDVKMAAEQQVRQTPSAGFTTSFLQPLPYLVSSFSLVLKQ